LQVSGLIVLDIDAATAEKRVLGRHDSARGLDDTPTVFAERVKYYAEQTVPVIDTFHRAAPQKVRVVSAQGKPAAVAADFTEAVKALTGKRRMQRVDL
jgi:adenylate kinase family enzyme